jgi:phosphopantetheinyl transferase (holo-ACP synthase)
VSKSTGNDVVALKAIDRERSGNAGFYSKILSVSEHALYCPRKFADMPFEEFLWLLWSVKESIYKYLKRSLTGLLFSPVKIVIQRVDLPYSRTIAKFEGLQWENGDGSSVGDFYRGTALCETGIFYFRSKVHAEFISTVVSATEDFENIRWGVKRVDRSGYDHQSIAVRAFVLDKLKLLLSGDDLKIAKSDAGHPIVLKGTEETGIPLSLAHHDHFIAYSFLMKN